MPCYEYILRCIVYGIFMCDLKYVITGQTFFCVRGFAEMQV